jgi:hypothetical protein
VSVGIDQLPDERGGDRRTGSRDKKEAASLAEGDTGDRLDADCRAIQLELYLATADQADVIAQGARNYQASCPINGCSHGRDHTTRLGAP